MGSFLAQGRPILAVFSRYLIYSKTSAFGLAISIERETSIIS